MPKKEEVEEEIPKKKKEKWTVGEVATQTAPIIINIETNESLPIEQAIARILNNQEKLMKGLLE